METTGHGASTLESDCGVVGAVGQAAAGPGDLLRRHHPESFFLVCDSRPVHRLVVQSKELAGARASLGQAFALSHESPTADSFGAATCRTTRRTNPSSTACSTL